MDMKEKRRNLPVPPLIEETELFAYGLKRMWIEGDLDDYDNQHFLIRAANGDKDLYGDVLKYCGYVSELGLARNGFVDSFCMNFSAKMSSMESIFGHESMKEFVKNQLAAGKKHYQEEQFFRALTEVEVLQFFACFGPGFQRGVYEPKSGNGNCNPEATFYYCNGSSINIEVKTPEFCSGTKGDVVMPLRLLDEKGIKEFEKYSYSRGLNFLKPRMSKLKSFLESACDKFHVPDENEYNLLCINWSYTDVPLNGYVEPAMLLNNSVNGMMNHREIAKKAGVSEEIYEKISAILIFQNSLEAIETLDLRYLWAGYPRKAVLILNPFILNTKEKMDRFYNSFQIRPKDFEMNFELPLYYNVDSRVSPVNLYSLRNIVDRNML